MDEVADVLDSWKGARVAVRITAGRGEQLIAVFSGRLMARSEEKSPALFWPIEQQNPPPAERPGIYLHANTYIGGAVHEGRFVVVLIHGHVTTNVRRLDGEDA